MKDLRERETLEIYPGGQEVTLHDVEWDDEQDILCDSPGYEYRNGASYFVSGQLGNMRIDRYALAEILSQAEVEAIEQSRTEQRA